MPRHCVIVDITRPYLQESFKEELIYHTVDSIFGIPKEMLEKEAVAFTNKALEQ